MSTIPSISLQNLQEINQNLSPKELKQKSMEDCNGNKTFNDLSFISEKESLPKKTIFSHLIPFFGETIWLNYDKESKLAQESEADYKGAIFDDYYKYDNSTSEKHDLKYLEAIY